MTTTVELTPRPASASAPDQPSRTPDTPGAVRVIDAAAPLGDVTVRTR
jgi:hypothetical protein